MSLFELERTSPPQVLNKHRDTIPSEAVYIGRGSPWGNPFRIGLDGDRADVIELFKSYLDRDQELSKRVKEELRGKDLVCFCAPLPCHGDVLVKLANNS